MKTHEKVIDVLKKLSGRKVIGDGAVLREDLGFDSLYMLNLLIEIEDVFEIRLEESDMDPFSLITAGDVVRLAQKYTGGQKGEQTVGPEGGAP